MQPFRKLSLIFILLLSGIYSWPVFSQRVPVVEAGQGQAQEAVPIQRIQPPAGGDSSQNEIMVNMYLQLEALQAEIQNLRGLVEEQSYQIRRMQTEQRDRYLDTDSRIGELYNQVQAYHGGQAPAQLPAGQPAPRGNQAVNVQPAIPATAPATAPANNGASTGAGIAANMPQNEQELYRQALNLLLENEAFQESITLFQQYIDVYPQGRYLTNALYWQGAAMELAGNYNQAIVVLQRLINEYPTDAKAPTAMLRLGTVYREMGDLAQARASWQRISSLYPDSTSEIEIAN